MHLEKRGFPLSVPLVNELCGVINSVYSIKQRDQLYPLREFKMTVVLLYY